MLKHRKTDLNIMLILGIIIVFLLILVSFFADSIVKLDPYAIVPLEISFDEGEITFSETVRPPNKVNLFGTDIVGRDMFSRIVYGTRITLKLALLITFVKFLLALPISFISGFNGKISSKIIDFFGTAFSAIPALLVCILVLSITTFLKLELNASIIAFSIVVGFVSWGRLGRVLRDRIQNILNEKFIEGEVAIGKSNYLIALQNILPHLTSTIIVYIFLEISYSLIMVAELGIFGIFVGVNRINSALIADLQLDTLPTYHPEWGAMLAYSRWAISGGRSWIF